MASCQLSCMTSFHHWRHSVWRHWRYTNWRHCITLTSFTISVTSHEVNTQHGHATRDSLVTHKDGRHDTTWCGDTADTHATWPLWSGRVTPVLGSRDLITRHVTCGQIGQCVVINDTRLDTVGSIVRDPWSPDLDPKWVRLAPNGTNRVLFQGRFQ